MAKQLEVLGGEIKQREPYLDRTSQFDVEEFNRKVDGFSPSWSRFGRRTGWLINLSTVTMRSCKKTAVSGKVANVN